jgi:branched-chain amino acid transport system permease protein
MPIEIWIEQIINGIILGSTYALVAGGLNLIWGTMHILNFAHGEFYMLGGFGVYFTFALAGIHPIIAIPLTIAAVFLIGMLVERLAIHYLLGRPAWEFSTIVATLGVSIFLQNLALALWGSRFYSVPYFAEGIVAVGDIILTQQRLLIFAISVVTLLLMWYVFKRTRFGFALRAASQDRDTAVLYGVNTYRVYALTFGVAAALAALAGIMLAPIASVNPWMGTPPLLKGFVVVVLGGLGSFQGAILGGILLGVAESLAVILASSEWSEVIAFSALIIVLWFRPWGLLGTKVSG